MALSLADMPVMVVNVPKQTGRRDHMTRMLGAHGVAPTFVKGVKGKGKIRGAALGHMAAFDTAPSTPFVVLEDDVGLLRDDVVVPSIPTGADVLYLGTHTGGCLPNRPENKDAFGHRHMDGFALASAHDDTWWQLHTMISAHAVVILTEEARAIWRDQLRIARNRKTPLDVRYAYLMADRNVFALRKQMFAEMQELQPEDKRSAERKALTHDPLAEARPGDQRQAVKRGWHVTAEVVTDQSGRLSWNVVEKRKASDDTPPVQGDDLRP